MASGIAGAVAVAHLGHQAGVNSIKRSVAEAYQ